MKKILLIILVLLLAAPFIAHAKEIKHIKTSEDQQCYECHSNENDVWQDSKHGLMGVGCVVCHGDPNKDFAAKPGPERCVGCHADQVAGKAEHHSVRPKNCWTCHQGHSLKTKSGK